MNGSLKGLTVLRIAVDRQKLFWVLAEEEILRDGYPNKPCCIDQDIRDSSGQHSFVAEDLESTEDCWMGEPEPRRGCHPSDPL